MHHAQPKGIYRGGIDIDAIESSPRYTKGTDMQSYQELEQRWAEIQNAGGPEAFIRRELERRGVYRHERPNILGLSEKEQKEIIRASQAERQATSELRQYVLEARKATHILYLGPDIFWNDFLQDDHFDPFARDERLEQSGLPILHTVDDLVTFLQKSVSDLDIPMLRSFCYHRAMSTTCHYRQFSIPKKSGGVRNIWAPLPKLKALQKQIQLDIVEKMITHGAAHGFVSGKSIYTNALEHTDSSLVIGVDLQDFFPTFTYPRVRGLFRSYGYSIGVATLLAAICTEAPRRQIQLDGTVYYIAAGPRCLPQGSPASPAITNAMCLRLDRRLSQYAINNGWRYTRYADDLTFSTQSTEVIDYAPLLAMLKVVTKAEGLQIHPKKTSIMSKKCRQEVTGLVVNGAQTPRVPKERRKLLRAALHNHQHNPQGLNIADALTIEQLIGHSAFVYMAHPEIGRSLLDAFAQLQNTST